MPVDDDDKLDEDSVEFQPIERRSTPRGPVPGLSVEGLEGEPIADLTFQVGELGLESFFIVGEEASQCEPKRPYRVRLVHGDQSVECWVECIRTETEDRVGAVMRLRVGEKDAKRLISSVLKPSGVPLGTH
jgi:hypothetical protein